MTTNTQTRRPKKPGRVQRNSANSRMTARYTELQATTMMHSEYVRHLLDPDGTDAQRIPDDITATSAVFKAPTITEVPSGGVWDSGTGKFTTPGSSDPGESIIGLMPGVAASIWTTAGVNYAIATTSASTTDNLQTRAELIDDTPPAVLLSARHAIRDGDHGVLPRLSESLPSIPMYNINAVYGVAAGSQELRTTFNYVDRANARHFNTLRFTLYRRSTISGNWITSTVSQRDNTAVLDSVYLAGDSFDAFAFTVENISGEKLDGYLIAGLAAAPGFRTCDVTFPAFNSTHFLVQDWDGLSTLSETSMERTTALSGLVTYMGSDLQNGGTISAARLATGISIADAPRGDIFSYLAEVPVYGDDYPLKLGGYAWWAPDSCEENFFTPYMSPQTQTRNVTSLWFAANRDDRSQSIRLRAIQGLEVITRSVQYTSLSGDVNPNFPLLLALAKTLPAVTENPMHALLSKMWNNFQRVIEKRSTWDKLGRWGLGAVKTLLQ